MRACAATGCATRIGVLSVPRPSATPKLDRVVTLRDGRRMAYAEWGRPDGRPVVLFHGMPGSRLLCPDEDETERAGVRLITIDRPGYGNSSPNPGRTLLSWVSDYVEWAALVGLPPCPIVGWSSGGPYALAVAAHRPDCVTSVGLAASPAPLDEVPSEWDGLPAEVRSLTKLLRRDAPAALEGINARCQWFATDWETIFEPASTSSSTGVNVADPDDALLADRDILEPSLAEMREAARQGTAGYVEDWIAESLPWCFSPAEVTHDVRIWWGDGDQLVRGACAEYFARAIKQSTLTVLAGEGHLFPYRHWREVLAALH
jgi:pimeloyl-ACP methyl ester carboxylesterase